MSNPQCPTCEKISCPTQSCPDNTKSYVGKATELCMNDPTIDDGCAELAKTDEQVIKIITQAGKDEGKKLCKTNPTTCKIFTKPTDNTKLTINTYIENNISEFATLVNKKCITNVNSNNCGITIATSEGKNAGKEECRNNLSECFTQIGSHETIVNKDCDNKNCASAEYGKLHLPTIEIITDTEPLLLKKLEMNIYAKNDEEFIFLYNLEDFVTTKKLALKIEGNGEGTVISNPSRILCTNSDSSDCKDNYESDTDVDLFAIPQNGSNFDKWDGDCEGTDNHITVTMDIDKENCKATFIRHLS